MEILKSCISLLATTATKFYCTKSTSQHKNTGRASTMNTQHDNTLDFPNLSLDPIK